MKPIMHDGKEVSIKHLTPSEITCECSPIGRDLMIRVGFSNHCYTKAFNAEIHSKEQIVLYDAPDRPRVFCPIRYGLSSCLPAVVADMTARKVHQTTQRRNYVYVVPLDVQRPIYEVYFMLQRAQTGHGCDLRLTIESAYPVEALPVLAKRPNSIRFHVLAYKVLTHQPVKFAAR